MRRVCHCSQLLFRLRPLYRRLIIGGGFSFLKRNGSGRAVGQAVAKAVAEMFPHELCLAVYDVDCALMTCLRAQPTAVALFLVYMNDFTDHGVTLLLCSALII